MRFMLKVREALKLKKSFKTDSKKELATADESIKFRKTVAEIKKIFQQMISTVYGGKFISMRTGQPVSYDEFGSELKTIPIATFKK
jgi:hypothetical protein